MTAASDYTPREGTNAATILAFLRAHPGTYRSGDLREAAGVTKGNFTPAIRALVDAGLVTKAGLGVATEYTLDGVAPPQGDSALQIAAYNDGDVAVAGGRPTSDGGVMYTREQLQQLLEFVTRPHLPLATVASTSGGAS
jgi:hypothetical protein